MQQRLDDRHRTKSGEISRKHGNTLVSTLRSIYGASFARGALPNTKLSDVLLTLDEPSLSALIRHHYDKTLPERITGIEQMYKASEVRGHQRRVRGPDTP